MNRGKAIIISLLVGLLFIAANKLDLKEVTIMSGKATIQIPKEIIISEQHSFTDALDGFTDSTKNLRFSYIVFGKMGDKKIVDRIDAMEKEFVTRPHHKLLFKGIKKVDGHDVAYFYIQTQENYINNLVFSTDITGELVTFVYATNSPNQTEWLATGMQIIKSLTIK